MEGKKVTIFWSDGGWTEYMVDMQDQAPIPENSQYQWPTFRHDDAEYLKADFEKSLRVELPVGVGVRILFQQASRD